MAGQQDENKLIAQRREKLAAIRAQGAAYPNYFRRIGIDRLVMLFTDAPSIRYVLFELENGD